MESNHRSERTRVLTILICTALIRRGDSQCYTKELIATDTSSLNIKENDINVGTMISGFLDLKFLLKQENFKVIGERLVSEPGDPICKFLGTGIPIHDIQRLVNATVMHPILTQAVFVRLNILLSHVNITTMVSLEQFTNLVQVLELENQISSTGDRSLVFFRDGNRKIITNFRVSDRNS